ncbi:hypothetical protein BOTBODRAFT_169470 [Botryobasidium botryosum FD-172 SS1]|uniref:Phosducin thioredoxin-like domain-containing protein n=1 Tax=Botryobasidium botryosum (strain FD-172 SS1) TaxID=930990 RepID=A0A067MYC1_BOTB1|nr:hypothetical protein BOTBODRAFT_169470 [Botryobasidium botryosum FD-172 SS1]
MSNDQELDFQFVRPDAPSVDPQVSSLASRLEPSTSKNQDDDDKSDISDSELFDELENDDALRGLRERRMEELKNEMAKVRDMRESEHGRYTEITDEKQVIQTSANEPRCVIHFYHRDFQRCKIMDKHLGSLLDWKEIAPKYFSTRFIRVFVENVPWLVEKLAIKVLPCVVCFVGGVLKERLIGFEEMGNNDSFSTASLEFRLAQTGVITLPKTPGSAPSSGRNIRGKAEDDDELDI